MSIVNSIKKIWQNKRAMFRFYTNLSIFLNVFIKPRTNLRVHTMKQALMALTVLSAILEVVWPGVVYLVSICGYLSEGVSSSPIKAARCLRQCYSSSVSLQGRKLHNQPILLTHCMVLEQWNDCFKSRLCLDYCLSLYNAGEYMVESRKRAHMLVNIRIYKYKYWYYDLTVLYKM